MFDFIKELLSSFRQNSIERIKSPFLGAFVFSWFGFNWQLLAVLFMSKSSILTRLEYINLHFDLKSLLIGPMCTTTLICIMLPYAHKYVTKFQKKTNHETNDLLLSAKIEIAEKQLVLADYEAKKKLSDERERKNIESNIVGIISSRDQLEDRLKEAREFIEAQNKNNKVFLENEHNYKKQLSEHIAKIDELVKTNENLVDRITGYKKNEERCKYDFAELSTLKKERDQNTTELLRVSLELKKESDEKHKLIGEVKALRKEIEDLKNENLSKILAGYSVSASLPLQGMTRAMLSENHGVDFSDAAEKLSFIKVGEPLQNVPQVGGLQLKVGEALQNGPQVGGLQLKVGEALQTGPQVGGLQLKVGEALQNGPQVGGLQLKVGESLQKAPEAVGFQLKHSQLKSDQ